MTLQAYLDGELRRLESQGLLRSRSVEPGTAELIDVSTNDYLGYARRLVSRETKEAQVGAGASRLIFGTHPEHRALEAELADWVGAEAALLFPSGYAANLGAISALVRPGDLIVSDRLNHASLVDGCRLARAEVQIVPHRDLRAVKDALGRDTAGRRWVVTESYFSMDGDSPDLPELRRLCDTWSAALFLDEAHALGVFGPEGAGLARATGTVPDVLVGTFGKAVGVQGAMVAGSRALIDFLWNRARSFVFTTAPSPLLTALLLENVRKIRRDDESRARLAHLCECFESTLSIPANLPEGRHGPIFPILLGTPERAVRAAAALREQGFLVRAIRPPTVPDGSSRLRIALHADSPQSEAVRLAAALRTQCGS